MEKSKISQMSSQPAMEREMSSTEISAILKGVLFVQEMHKETPWNEIEGTLDFHNVQLNGYGGYTKIINFLRWS